MTDEELMKIAFAEDKTVADILRHIFKLGQDNANERIESLIAEIHDKVYAEGVAKGRADERAKVNKRIERVFEDGMIPIYAYESVMKALKE